MSVGAMIMKCDGKWGLHVSQCCEVSVDS